MLLTKGLSSLVVLAAMASVVITMGSFTAASPLESQEGFATTTTTGPSNTYFGVDANDKEAIAEKQRELSHEKWRQMMGDVNIEDIDFSPELGSPFDFLKTIFSQQASSEHMKRFRTAIKNVAEKVRKVLMEGPDGEEIRKHLGDLYKVTSEMSEQPGNPLQAAFKKFQEIMSRKD